MLIKAKAEVHTRPLISARKRARDKLHRHGFNYKKRCRLTVHADHCLMKTRAFGLYPGIRPMYAGLFHYERMHVYFINFCTYTLDMLATLVPPSQYGNVAKACHECRQFRDPDTGVTHPRLPDVLKMTHLTAERRVRAIFIWAHVLGTRAEVIPEPCRMHAKTAVATLQLLLIAVRGHRPYSLRELDVIFKEVGTQFFRAIEAIGVHVEGNRVRRARARHERNPNRYRAPVPFRRSKRLTTVEYIHISRSRHIYAHFRTYILIHAHICSSSTSMRNLSILAHICSCTGIYAHICTYMRDFIETTRNRMTPPIQKTRHIGVV